MSGPARVFRRLLIAIALALLGLQLWYLAWVTLWRYVNPDTTHFMEIRLAELREKKPGAELEHRWVPYEQISMNLKRAVVASEDDRFVEHEGFDWQGMQKALEKDQR